MLGPQETYQEVRRGAVWRSLTCDGLAVTGAGAFEWLQGQVSQDLEGLGAGEARQSLVLSPQGKLDAVCRIWCRGDAYVLDVEQGLGDRLEERLRRFKLRVKADLERVELKVLECRGPAAQRFKVGGAMVDAWAGFFGWYALEPDTAGADLPPEGDATAFEVARIEAGVPRMGRELTERTIPQEAGTAFVSRTVSFTKGCFTGQELVARVDARGSNVPRRLCGLVGEGWVEAGDELRVEQDRVGEVTSSGESPAMGVVGLAMVKRGLAVPTTVTVTGDGGSRETRAEIRALPLVSG